MERYDSLKKAVKKLEILLGRRMSRLAEIIKNKCNTLLIGIQYCADPSFKPAFHRIDQYLIRVMDHVMPTTSHNMT